MKKEKKDDKIKGLDKFDDEFEDNYDEYDEEIEEESKDEKSAKVKKESPKKNKKSKEKKSNKKTTQKGKNQTKEEIKKVNTQKTIINVVFIVIVVLILMVVTDVICVNKFNVGPYFAIKTKTYKDGGSKEYYGLGYKVIEYNEFEGRKGKTIGTWKLEYNTNPAYIDIIDAALEFENDKQKTANKLYNEYLKVEGTISEIDIENRNITIEYKDEENKYSLKVVGKIIDDVIMQDYKVNDHIYLIGTARKFITKTKDSVNKIILENCHTEQA